jgi:two-component system response regulator AtoC
MSSTTQHKIVILDSDPQRRDHLRSMLTENGYTPFLFEKESRCLDNIAPLNPDLVISGSLPADKAYRFINTIKSTKSDLPVLIISDDKAISDFINTNGLDDIAVINENLNSDEMQRAIAERLENNSNNQPRRDCPLIIGNTPEMVKIKQLIPVINKLNETVLIQGEHGTGKDLLARAIHFKSDRQDQPFVKIDIPELVTIQTEKNKVDAAAGLLPHELDSRKELLAKANTGTLFLDEIGALTTRYQTDLLHFLKGFKNAGPGPNANDIRVIVATTIDLERLVARGQFRKDLYYRLNVINLGIPPLRKRIEDLPQLADFFTDRFCHQLGKSHYELSAKTKTIFSSYFWPGNVRQLENLVRDIVARGEEDSQIEKLLLLSENHRLRNNFEGFLSHGELTGVKNYVEETDNYSLKDIGQKFCQRFEKRLVKKVLDSTNWNRRKAAAMLDISYKSLLNKIKEYNLTEAR